METQKRKLTIMPDSLAFKKVKGNPGHHTGMRHTMDDLEKKGI